MSARAHTSGTLRNRADSRTDTFQILLDWYAYRYYLLFLRHVNAAAFPNNLSPKLKFLWNIYLPPSQRIVSYGFTRLEKASDGRENVLVITDVF